MKPPFNELLLGFGTAGISILLVLGALMVSQAEFLPPPVSGALDTTSPTAATQLSSPQATKPAPSLAFPTLTPCPAPKGWLTYITQPGDTVESLAATYAITVDSILRYNCMNNPTLLANTDLYLPPHPTPTPTLTSAPGTPTLALTDTPSPTPIPSTPANTLCAVPAGWKPYRVKSGDTLSSIGQTYGINYLMLLDANCKPRNYRLIAGNTLYVPNSVTSTPKTPPTFTPEPPQPTPEPDTPTSPPRKTPVKSPTTAEPTATPLPTTSTPTPTVVPPTDVPTPTPTPTSTPTSAPTATPTPTPTNTPAPTSTDTPTPTPTSESTATPTPTPTPA